jgi:hypothetical protein
MRPAATVRVTAGRRCRGDSHGCAIALAIRGACPQASSIHVGGPTVLVSAGPWDSWTAFLPPEAHEFIRLFDRRRWRKPKPVTFTLCWQRGAVLALTRADLVVAAA